VPFKNSVSNVLSVNENGEDLNSYGYDDNNEQLAMDGFEDEEDNLESLKTTKHSEIQLLYADFLRALNQLYSAVKKHKKLKEERKEELIIIIKAIKEAVAIEKIVFLNALIIPLEYSISKDKYLKYYYNDLKNCLMNFYNL